MEYESLCGRILASFLDKAEGNASIKNNAQKKIIEIAKNMGIMGLNYYDITRKNNWIFSEITNKINAEIQNYLDSLNILSVQRCCIRAAQFLSFSSFAIFEPDVDSKCLLDYTSVASL